MRITITEILNETVNKGRTPYFVANVSYQQNGQARTQKILSFANPDTYKALQEYGPGDEAEVTVTKNAQGYNQWAKIEKVSKDDAPKQAASASATGGKVLGSQYETREERITRQLHIVRQSSLANAVAILTPGAKAPLDVATVVKVAQELVDFVYQNETLETGFGIDEAISGGQVSVQ